MKRSTRRTNGVANVKVPRSCNSSNTTEPSSKNVNKNVKSLTRKNHHELSPDKHQDQKNVVTKPVRKTKSVRQYKPVEDLVTTPPKSQVKLIEVDIEQGPGKPEESPGLTPSEKRIKEIFRDEFLCSQNATESMCDVRWDCTSPDAIRQAMKRPIRKTHISDIAQRLKVSEDTNEESEVKNKSLLGLWQPSVGFACQVKRPTRKSKRNNIKKKIGITPDLTLQYQQWMTEIEALKKPVENVNVHELDCEEGELLRDEILLKQVSLDDQVFDNEDEILLSTGVIKCGKSSCSSENTEDNWSDDDLFDEDSFLMQASQMPESKLAEICKGNKRKRDSLGLTGKPSKDLRTVPDNYVNIKQNSNFVTKSSSENVTVSQVNSKNTTVLNLDSKSPTVPILNFKNTTVLNVNIKSSTVSQLNPRNTVVSNSNYKSSTLSNSTYMTVPNLISKSSSVPKSNFKSKTDTDTKISTVPLLNSKNTNGPHSNFKNSTQDQFKSRNAVNPRLNSNNMMMPCQNTNNSNDPNSKTFLSRNSFYSSSKSPFRKHNSFSGSPNTAQISPIVNEGGPTSIKSPFRKHKSFDASQHLTSTPTGKTSISRTNQSNFTSRSKGTFKSNSTNNNSTTVINKNAVHVLPKILEEHPVKQTKSKSLVDTFLQENDSFLDTSISDDILRQLAEPDEVLESQATPEEPVIKTDVIGNQIVSDNVVDDAVLQEMFNDDFSFSDIGPELMTSCVLAEKLPVTNVNKTSVLLNKVQPRDQIFSSIQTKSSSNFSSVNSSNSVTSKSTLNGLAPQKPNGMSTKRNDTLLKKPVQNTSSGSSVDSQNKFSFKKKSPVRFSARTNKVVGKVHTSGKACDSDSGKQQPLSQVIPMSQELFNDDSFNCDDPLIESQFLAALEKVESSLKESKK